MLTIDVVIAHVRKRVPRLPQRAAPESVGAAHTPRNVNHALHSERVDGGFNQWLAVKLTKYAGTMQTAYVFTGIGIGSIVGVLTNNVLLALILGSLSSYLIQLVLLPVIMVGQNVLNRHAELMAEEQFATTTKVYADVEKLQADVAEALALLHALHDLQMTPDVTRALKALPQVKRGGTRHRDILE